MVAEVRLVILTVIIILVVLMLLLLVRMRMRLECGRDMLISARASARWSVNRVYSGKRDCRRS